MAALCGNDVMGQAEEQTLPALGDPAPMNDSIGNQEVTVILQKWHPGKR